MLDVFQLIALRVDEELETILFHIEQRKCADERGSMRTKRVEDLTTAELTEIRFASAALQKRRTALENEKKLHEATIQWTRNPGVKRALTQRNEEIDKEILKTMRQLSDAR